MINNIIFDLGGVLWDLNFNSTIEALRAIEPDRFDEIGPRMKQDPIFLKYELGKVPPALFIDAINSYYSTPPPRATIEAAWNAMLVHFPEERVRFLREIRKKYRIFLLSNTNEIHIQHCDQKVREWYGINQLSDLFEKAYYSHQIGMRKPDPAIFEFVLNDLKIKPENTLFADDLPENLEAARKLGIHTYHVTPENQVLNLINVLS